MVIIDSAQCWPCLCPESLLATQGRIGKWPQIIFISGRISSRCVRVICMLHDIAAYCFSWYRANYSMAQRLDWGRGKGCDFVMKSCKFWIGQQSRRYGHDAIYTCALCCTISVCMRRSLIGSLCRNRSVSPFCHTLRTNPLKLACRQDQRAVAICNLQRFPQRLPQEYRVCWKSSLHRPSLPAMPHPLLCAPPRSTS